MKTPRPLLLVGAVLIVGVLAIIGLTGIHDAKYTCRNTGAQRTDHAVFIPFWATQKDALILWRQSVISTNAIHAFLMKHVLAGMSLNNLWNSEGAIDRTLWGAVAHYTPATPGRCRVLDSFGNEALMFTFLAATQKTNPAFASQLLDCLHDPYSPESVLWRKEAQLAYMSSLLDVYMKATNTAERGHVSICDSAEKP